MIREISEKKQVKFFLVIFSFVNIIVLAIYAAIPAWDTIWFRQTYSGGTYIFTFTFLWWIFFVAFIFNFLVVIALFAVIADSSQKTRGDLHFIVTFASLIMNVLFVVVCTIFYFFYTNTSYSGAIPTNDPRWCCLYYTINGGLCPNNSPCTVPVNLTPDPIFILQWIFSGVFCVLSIFHIGINRLLRSAKILTRRLKSIEEAKFLGVGICWLYLAVLAFWVAFPLWLTIIYDYYDYQWWFLWFLTFNLAPPVLMLISMNFRRSVLLQNAFFWLTVLVVIVSGVTLLVFIGIWGFDCNNNFLLNSDTSICNDYQYCCQHFDTARRQCINVTPCQYTLNLSANPEFVQHMIFAFLFTLFGSVLLWINYRLRAYGYFPSEKIKKEKVEMKKEQ